MSKYGHRPHNWFEAIVNKLGGEEDAERFLRGELAVAEPTRSWREEDGVIYFSVQSDGTTGEDWITRLESKGFRVRYYANGILRSPDFKPTSGMSTEIAVLKGRLFEDDDRITNNIRAEAEKRKLGKPNPEVACLIREKFTDKELRVMGLWWVAVMHEPIKGFDGAPSVLGVNHNDCGRWLDACHARPDSKWNRDCGFAFAVPQV